MWHGHKQLRSTLASIALLATVRKELLVPSSCSSRYHGLMFCKASLNCAPTLAVTSMLSTHGYKFDGTGSGKTVAGLPTQLSYSNASRAAEAGLLSSQAFWVSNSEEPEASGLKVSLPTKLFFAAVSWCHLERSSVKKVRYIHSTHNVIFRIEKH